MGKAKPITEPRADVTYLPLSDLYLSPLNVRKAETDVTDLETNIQANGLLQSLVVYPGVQGKFAVICGGRRLKALQNLAERDELSGFAANYPVPCRVVTDDKAVAASLSENQQRAPMHAVDEAEAFAALLAAKVKKKTIGLQYGVTPRYIDQRAKLAAVAPELRDACRKGRMNLECLQAFTLTEDHDEQRRVYAVVSKDGADVLADGYVWEILNKLEDNFTAADSALVDFVGIETYRAAGGTFVTDLFSDEFAPTLLRDVSLLNKLAEKKLKKEAKKYDGEGWLSVDVCLGPPSQGGYLPAYQSGDEWTEAERALARAVVGFDFIGQIQVWRGWCKGIEEKKALARLQDEMHQTLEAEEHAREAHDEKEAEKQAAPTPRKDLVREVALLTSAIIGVRSDLADLCGQLNGWADGKGFAHELIPIFDGLHACRVRLVDVTEGF